MPTDSFFSEDIDDCVLMRPTYLNWDHSYESPIPENGPELRDYQIDCVFNGSECHVNLQDHLSFSWNNFNKKYESNVTDQGRPDEEINYDWLQLSREEILEYMGKPRDSNEPEESLQEIKETLSENSGDEVGSIVTESTKPVKHNNIEIPEYELGLDLYVEWVLNDIQ